MKDSLPLRCDLQTKGEGSPEDMEKQLARYDQNPGGLLSSDIWCCQRPLCAPPAL